MKTILVIGGSGFLGSHVVRRLASDAYDVTATYASRQPAPAPGVRWIACDLRDRECDRDWPTRCDYVLYLAQSSAWRQFPAGADDVFAVNLYGLHRAAQYAVRAGAKTLLFASSGSVYVNPARPACETDAIGIGAPRSHYVATKLASEILLRAYEKLFAVGCLRIFMPYGSGQGIDMLMPQLIKKIREGQPIQLHGEHGLLANPVAANDVAEAFARCLDLTASTTLNVAGPQLLTLREIGEAIGRALHRPVAFQSSVCEKVPVIAGETTLLRDTLGWSPSTRFDSGISDWLVGASSTAAA